MPKSFVFFEVQLFSQKTEFLIPIQKELLENEGEQISSLKLQTKQFINKFNKYICHHDLKVKRFGKVYGKTFNHFFEPKDFNLFLNKEDALCVIQTNIDTATDFVNQLNDSKEFSLSKVDINFEGMYPLINEVAGAWIADLKRTHLKKAGFFGPNVHKSEDFKAAAEEGNVSAIQMRYLGSDHQEHYVAISKKGAISLYDQLSSVEEEITLALEIYNTLVKPHIIV